MNAHRNRLSLRSPGFIALAAVVLGAWSAGADTLDSTADQSKQDRAEQASASDDGRPPFVTETVRGRVVWLAEALHRRFGIETDPDAAEWSVALEMSDGRLQPIAKDDRGRGFWGDPRLRNVEMELLVRRFSGSPVVQVIRVFTLKADGKYELDYWCDICAIPMYELKPCECCQGPIRLRERPIGDEDDAFQSTEPQTTPNTETPPLK